MRIDKVEPLDRRRSKVFLDGDFAFVLYEGEIRRYHIEEEGELEEALYREILCLVCRRAREKAVALLKSAPRTEWEMKKRLREAFFPQEAVEEAVELLKRYGYLDDEAYARNFVEVQGGKKSRAELSMALKRKGIDSELVRAVCEELPCQEEQQIRRLLEKRGYDRERATLSEKQKAYAYLARRGFSSSEIRRNL